MKNKTYKSLTNEEKIYFFEYLKSIKATNVPAYSNMWTDDWQNNPNTLPYVLEKTNRFDDVNGVFYILYDGANIVACGGVYKSQFNNLIGIGGVRTWTDTKYRHSSLLREYLLPLHKSWCVEQGLGVIALTFNEYNKNLIQVFKRRRLGEKNDRINSREPKHVFYNGLHELEFPVTIQYTKQWIIYEKLEEGFKFNWGDIQWKY
jgi:hypothetical protein